MRKVLFVDRDGTLIEDDAGRSPDSPEGVRLVRGVIPALLRFKAAGYELVIVTNQGGLGTASHPREPFERVDAFVHALLASQGIELAANFVMVKARDGADFRETAHRAGVLVRTFDDPLLADCVRITVGRPADNDLLLRALAGAERASNA